VRFFWASILNYLPFLKLNLPNYYCLEIDLFKSANIAEAIRSFDIIHFIRSSARWVRLSPNKPFHTTVPLRTRIKDNSHYILVNYKETNGKRPKNFVVVYIGRRVKCSRIVASARIVFAPATA